MSSVADPTKRDIEQRIVVNTEGLELRKAWNWKLEGISDAEITGKLRALGVSITKQKISRMWRNAFYCGIQTNSFLDGNPIKGNWEPLVSEADFWAVQRIIDGNHQGYAIEKNNGARPLIGTLLCPDCGKSLQVMK